MGLESLSGYASQGWAFVSENGSKAWNAAGQYKAQASEFLAKNETVQKAIELFNQYIVANAVKYYPEALKYDVTKPLNAGLTGAAAATFSLLFFGAWLGR